MIFNAQDLYEGAKTVTLLKNASLTVRGDHLGADLRSVSNAGMVQKIVPYSRFEGDKVESFHTGAEDFLLALQDVLSLHRTVAQRRSQEVEIRWGDSGKVLLVCGDNVVQVPTDHAGPDPLNLPPASANALVDGKDLSRALKGALKAVDRDKHTLEVLHGVCWEFGEGALSVMATDRYRLFHVNLSTAQTRGEGRLSIHADLLKHFVSLLAKHESVHVNTYGDGEWLGFTVTDVSICLRAQVGVYPRVNSVLEASTDKTVTVDRKSLISAVEQEKKRSDSSRMPFLKLAFDASGVLVSPDPSCPDGFCTHVPCMSDMEVGEFTIVFAAKFLLDGLKSLTADRVEFRCAEPDRPAFIVNEGDAVMGLDSPVYALMPVRTMS